MPFGYPLCFWKPSAVERCAQVLFFKGEHSCGCWRAGRPKGGWSTVASLACGTQGSVCVSLMCLLLSPDTGQSLSWSAGPAGWRLEHISGTPREALTMLPQEPERSFSQSILHPPLGQKDKRTSWSSRGVIYGLHIKSYSKNLLGSYPLLNLSKTSVVSITQTSVFGII